MIDRIGFMQGRLSAPVDGRIQSFPWTSWRDEFAIADRCEIRIMEWVLERDRLRENPLLTSGGQAEILELCQRHAVRIPSLTGDCFKELPFWKAIGAERDALQREFDFIADACAVIGISSVVIPLVDNGRIENAAQEDALVAFLASETDALSRRGLNVLFESDFAPSNLSRLISRLDPATFGINYDIGDSATMGFDPAAEISSYGDRILNVHVKDRVLHGVTVPFGTGNADFETVFKELSRVRFCGNCILQPARALDDDQIGLLCRYRDMLSDWLTRHSADGHAA